MGGDIHRLPPVAALILAAGASTRYGQPKQLLRYQGQSLLRRAAEAATASVCRPVVVVLGASAAQCADELRGLPVHLAENATWMEGMGASLRAGLGALTAVDPGVDAAVVTLCDQPLVSAHIIDALVERYRASGAPIVASAYAGTRGVPALFGRSLFERLLSLHGGEGARGVIASSGDEVQAIPFPEGVVDIDTPRDYAVLQTLDASSVPVFGLPTDPERAGAEQATWRRRSSRNTPG